MTLLTVEELTTAHDAEVETFLDDLSQKSPSVLAYYYPFYRNMLVELGIGTPLYLGARRGGELVGLLPVFTRQSEVGTAFCSMPFFGPNAGVLCALDGASQGIHFSLLTDVLTRAKEAGAISCSIYTPFLFSDFTWYDAFKPDAVTDRFTQFSSIGTDEWNSGIRYDLRRANRFNITVCNSPDASKLEEFYAIYSENCREYDIPLKPKRCIDFLAGPEVNERHSRIYFAYHEGRMIAGLLVVFSPTTASYYVPCSRRESRTLQPGTLLVHKAFHDLQASGVRIWNWESSPGRDSGVYKFKAKWNSRETQYRTYIWCPRGTISAKELDRERICRAIPYFFVFPFERL